MYQFVLLFPTCLDKKMSGTDVKDVASTRAKNEKNDAEPYCSNWVQRHAGAGDGIRTRDIQLGKLTLYH